MIAVIIYVFSIFLNAVKWHVILSDIDLRFLNYLTFRAQFYSTIFPGQLFGEFSKLTLWKNTGYTVSHITASVFFDKITGFIGQFILILIGLSLSKAGVSLDNKGIIIFLGLLFFVSIFVFSEKHVIELIDKMINWAERKTNKSLLYIKNFYSSWVLFSVNKIILLKSLIWGIVNQFMGIIMIWYVSNSLNLSVALIDYCWVIPLVSFILIVPVSFAGLGLREASLVSLLSLFGVAPEKAIIISLTLLLGQIVAALIGGIMNSIYSLKA